MPAGFSSTGLTIKTLEECRAEIVADFLENIDPTLDLSETEPMGQAVAICAQREAILWELIQTLAYAIDPDAAEDWLLDSLCALTGTLREPAKKSTVTVNCNVNNNTSFTAGQITLNVAGQPTIQFKNVAAVGPLTPAGVYPIAFESVEYGPVVANAGTLTVITTPISGLNSVTNPLDAKLGALREEDTSLRVRREDERTATGACTVESLRADLLQVDGVEQAFVFENTTLTTDSNGLPGKSFEAVIYDGGTPQAANADIATTVWGGKPSGAEMYGSTTTNIIDSTSTTRAVKFSRATVRNVYLTFENVVIDPEEFPSDGVTLIEDAVVAYAAKKQNLGVDVISVGMKSAALAVPGVIDVPTLKLGFSASPTGTANLEITGREIAAIDTSRITVTTVEGQP